MIDWPASLHRASLIAIALLLAIPLLRPALSSALVSRGDALLYARDPAATTMYRRAVDVDADDDLAADRYAFAALLSHRRSQVEDAIRVVGVALRSTPNDAKLRMDEALCLQTLKYYASAENDFAQVALQTNDVEAFLFAADDERKLSRIAIARRFLVDAVRIDPSYIPARLALRRIGL
jgi:tetratricopeptide (TPR) repeat protein